MSSHEDDGDAIAIVGMAGRFPQAWDLDAFWGACVNGVDCISRWEGESHPGRVPAGGLIAGQELFDAEAFGIAPAQAEILDPQHRVFLELCWQALEHAAIAPSEDVLVSVYAAAAPSRYQPEDDEAESENIRYQRMISNGADYLATRVSYHLDLRGEAVNVQTACSSSLVAVHMACLSLQTHRSDVALAGGVSIDPDQQQGYPYEEGMIASPDGRCRPFDAAASGAVPGNGAGVVVLQRLSDALKQKRTIHAVIRATALNNDGRSKSSFMAPTVEGQSQVIATAIATAGIPADSIGYLETHGTATALGDSIEFEAAVTAFSGFTDRRGFCALGSLKANFGHMDRAAGVAGLIKAVCAVREGVIPPLVGFSRSNPDFDVAASPFRIPTQAERWSADGPRRAGVSSFGVGGTNAHVIVEEFVDLASHRDGRPMETDLPIAFPLSAHDEPTLRHLAQGLARSFDDAPYALDVAHTLAKGRVDRPSRMVVLARPGRELGAMQVPSGAVVCRPAGPLVFLFPGQGTQTAYGAQRMMARYEVFRQEVEAFADVLGLSAEKLLEGIDGSDPVYRDFAYQPSLVAIQVALARLAEHTGLVPAAYCGNSIGEYAAAHLAGVFSRRALMSVLAARDREMRRSPEGCMLSVQLGEEEVLPLLLPAVDLAGINATSRVLLSGPVEDVLRQKSLLEARGVLTRVLAGRVGPHGRLMRGIAASFRRAFDDVELLEPSHRVVSTLTGTWALPGELTDPDHWVRHLCEPFRFSRALSVLTEAGFERFVEASPGAVLTRLVRTSDAAPICATLGGDANEDAPASFLAGLAEIWCSGCEVDWDVANGSAGAAFRPLPSYPFNRKRFWSHRSRSSQQPNRAGPPRGRLERVVWLPHPLDRKAQEHKLPRRVLVRGGGATASGLIEQLGRLGIPALRIEDASADIDGAEAVLVDVSLADSEPIGAPVPGDSTGLQGWLDTGLLGPVSALDNLRPAALFVLTKGLQAVVAGDRPAIHQGAVVGLVRCAPHDWPCLTTRWIDLPPDTDALQDASTIIAELSVAEEHDIAYRRGMRLRRGHAPSAPSGPSPLRPGGTYLVLGGTGRLGAVVAEAISREVQATIVLAGRQPDRPSSPQAQHLLEQATARGCQVLRRTARSDIAADLRRMLDELVEAHGRIDGVFHLAANTETETFELLGETSAASASGIAHAKVCTAALLADQLRQRDYDFVALFSSISTVIGASRFGAYVAANAYLDALAPLMAQATGRRWISMVWDGWSADGSAGPHALGFDEGAALLLQALRSQLAVVAPVVSSLDQRQARVREDLAVVARHRKVTGGESRSHASNADHVLRVIGDVTGFTEIDPLRQFAQLGIDSLRLMQIVVRLRPLAGASVSMGRLLGAKTIADLTRLLEAGGTVDDAPRREATSPDQGLSTPQERLWYLAQLDPISPSYNVPFGWMFPAESRGRVLEATRSVLDRHEMLRSVYREDADGRPRRAVVSTRDIPITELVLDPADPAASFLGLAREAAERPFDLSASCTRVLLAHGEDGVRLLFVCHHIAIDAWSVKVICGELHHAATGAGATPPRQQARYSEFVRWEHETRSGAEYERLASYWRDTLREVQPTIPPPDDGLDGATGHSLGVCEVVLEAGSLSALRAVLRDEGATLYAAAMTGLAVALGAWCRTPEVVVGTNLANRMREEFESVVGLFVDPVVLRVAPGLDDPAATLRTALARVRECLVAAVAHSGMPYLDVVRILARPRSAGDNPLFSIISTMFDASGEALAALDVPLPAHAKFPLAVEFLPRPDGLLVHALYANNRYSAATIEKFVGQIVRFLELLAKGKGDALLSTLVTPAPSESARTRFAQRFERIGARS